jgi:hypothetical protein
VPTLNLTNPDLITLTPGSYTAVTSPTMFPARVPVTAYGAKLKASGSGRFEFPEAVGTIAGVSVNGTDTTTGPVVIFGTGPDNQGGKGTKAHIIDLDVTEPGPTTGGAVEFRNLQNSAVTNIRLDNVRKASNGISVIHGSKGIAFRSPWSSDCKEWSFLIDTLAGDQQNSKITLDHGMAELSPVAVRVGDAELVEVFSFCMNTSIGIHIAQGLGTRTNPNTGATVPETQRRCRRLMIQGLRGNCPQFLKADYQVEVVDFGGHDKAFYDQKAAGKFTNVILVPA